MENYDTQTISYINQIPPFPSIQNFQILYKNELIGVSDASTEAFISYLITNSYVLGETPEYLNKSQSRETFNLAYTKNLFSYYEKYENKLFFKCLKVQKFTNYLSFNQLFFPYLLTSYKTLSHLNFFLLKKPFLIKACFFAYRFTTHSLFAYIIERNLLVSLKLRFLSKKFKFRKKLQLPKMKKLKKSTYKFLKKFSSYLKKVFKKLQYIYIAPTKKLKTSTPTFKDGALFLSFLINYENMLVKNKIEFFETKQEIKQHSLEFFPWTGVLLSEFFDLTRLVRVKKKKKKKQEKLTNPLVPEIPSSYSTYSYFITKPTNIITINGISLFIKILSLKVKK